MEFPLLSILPYAFLFISLSISYTFYKKSSHPAAPNLPPGNMGLPLIGESLKFLSDARKGCPEKFIIDRMAKFSSLIFKTSLFGEPMMVVCGTQGNKLLFSNEKKLVTPWFPATVEKLFPDTDNDSRGNIALRTRKIFQSVIKPESPDKLIEVMDLITHLHFLTSWESNGQVQVYPLARRYAFQLACRLFMSIEDPQEIEKLEGPFNLLASALFSVPIDLPGTTFNRGVKASRFIQEQLLEIIKRRRIDRTRDHNYEKRDILSHMLSFVDENGEHLSDTSIASKILGLLLGGHDTITSVITFIVKYLAELPHIYHQVFKEQMEISRTKATGEFLNWDDIQKMKYSWNVACEVMRLVPPAPGAFRETLTDFKFAGFSVPKGWKIHWNVSSTHKNPQYFSEPEKFDPSRFEGNGPAPYTFVPFGGGPRMCPGKEYARMAILVFMHNIVKRFKWENLLPHENIKFEPNPAPTNGLPILLCPHKSY